jgi:MoxR-like ATPase
MNDAWKVYRADGRTDGEVLGAWLETPPPWRRAESGLTACERTTPASQRSERRGATYVSSSRFRASDAEGPDEETQINIALMLRRPLLVTGDPGIGKSSLAYHLAWALDLGEPLRWEINSRTTLADGLYRYDAVGHLRAIQERQGSGAPEALGEFITLGPLGTALLPTPRPRVLLVDELDKAAYDLPNDLLHVFEEGGFEIPELVRCGGIQRVIPWDPARSEDRVELTAGRARTLHHPVVVVTSNAEREFPEAFLRRCIQLPLPRPGIEQLRTIVERQLGEDLPELDEAAIDDAAGCRYDREATDVILQGLFLERRFGVPPERAAQGLKRARR